MLNLESEYQLPNPSIKLCNPEDQIQIVGQHTSWSYMLGPSKYIEGIGFMSVNGSNFVGGSYEIALVLDHRGLLLKPTTALRDNHDMYYMSVERAIMCEKHPLPICVMTIDGQKFVLQAQMLGGNPELPEEAHDFIESWHIMGNELGVEVPLVIPPDPRIISLLNFHFR